MFRHLKQSTVKKKIVIFFNIPFHTVQGQSRLSIVMYPTYVIKRVCVQSTCITSRNFLFHMTNS